MSPTGLEAFVVGAGSIGGRHLRNLRDLGVSSLTVWDPAGERAEAAAAATGARVAESLEAGLAAAPDIVLVCSPPVFHIEQALRAIAAGAHVFVEKPLSNSLEGIPRLRAAAADAGRIVQVGYNLRFHPAVAGLRRLVESEELGRLLWLRAEYGQYLPEWRPQDDYRQSYTARAELGGGIVLDASHEIDYVLWMLGEPDTVAAVIGKISGLALAVEDSASIVLGFPTGAQASIHLDCFQRVYDRSFRAAFEQGTAVWSLGEALSVRRSDAVGWEELEPSPDVNLMYVDELAHFLDCATQGTRPLSNLDSATLALEIALAARAAGAQTALS